LTSNAAWAGAVELCHQLAMGQERGQPLLRRHTIDVISQAASSGFGQLRSHAVM
jgi:hypothetical protein